MDDLQNTHLIVLLIFTLSIQSCGENIKNSWTVKDFYEGKTFKIKGKEGKSYAAALVYVRGNVDQNICFRRNLSDETECREFSKDTTFIRSRYDYYGGEFSYQLLPSKAKGEITVTIELP